MIQGYPIYLTTQPVLSQGRIVVDGRQVAFVAGTSPIRDLTNASQGFTLISNVEEVYTNTFPDATARSNVLTTGYQIPAGRNLTDFFIATRVAATVASLPAYAVEGAGGAFSRLNFPGAQTADFAGVPVWTPVATSSYGVGLGNVRVPLLADDQANDHYVDRDLNSLADDLNGNGVPNAVIRNPNVGPTPVGDQAWGLSPKIAQAVNSVLNTGAHPITATALGSYVRLSRGSIENNSGIIARGGSRRAGHRLGGCQRDDVRRE